MKPKNSSIPILLGGILIGIIIGAGGLALIGFVYISRTTAASKPNPQIQAQLEACVSQAPNTSDYEVITTTDPELISGAAQALQADISACEAEYPLK